MTESITSEEPLWEYRQVMATPVDKLMQLLADEAKSGWELVSVVVEEPYYRAFLRRPTATSQKLLTLLSHVDQNIAKAKAVFREPMDDAGRQLGEDLRILLEKVRTTVECKLG